MTSYPTFTAGQKVRNRYGETLTVLYQIGCMVYVEEHMSHYHPSKLYAVSDRCADIRSLQD